jgi:hypothetical protein
MLRTERKPNSAFTCFILACHKSFIFVDKKHILKIDIVDDISILLDLILLYIKFNCKEMLFKVKKTDTS